MENYCLTREDYKDFLNHMLYRKSLKNDELADYIERAKDYFDFNIIGSNYHLSIIIEQLSVEDGIDENIIQDIYNLRELLYFTIEEHGYEFVNDIFSNYYPEAYNKHRQDLIFAIQRKDDKTIASLRSLFGVPFEQDLNRITKNYYDTKVRY